MSSPRPAIKPRVTIDGQWLYALRMSHGLRQSDVAADLRINQGRIAEWEQGQKPIPSSIKAKLQTLYAASATGIEPSA